MFEDFRLKIFLEVAALGNFTKAAHNIGISQAAVSQNISEIENAYGIRLFERSGRSKILTPEGKVFLAYAKKIVGNYKELDTVFRNYGKITAVRSVKIAVSRDALEETMSTLVPYIYDICPWISVQTVLLDYSSLPGSDESCDGPDITITGTGILRQMTPSEAFSENPLWTLIS